MDQDSPEFRGFRASQDIWLRDLERALEYVQPIG
jgi:hypothetical protein